MTREILFRGKRLDNGEWVEGFLVVGTDRINNGKCYILPGLSDFSYGDNGNRIRIGCFVEVDPSTVGQFTGLCDKNGKKIFEGDIVNIHDHTNFDMTGAVEWNDCGFEIHDKETDAFEVLWYAPTVITVLGNIHDNPELLEGKG